MGDEKIREWVEEKLDQGIEPERLKKSLRETGRDPSVVDEVNSPFEGEAPDEDLFQDEDAAGEVEEQEDRQEPDEQANEVKGEQEDGISLPEFTFPDFSLPSIHMPSVNTRLAVGLLGIFLVGLAGFGVYTAGIDTGAVIPEKETGSPAAPASSCSEVGVRIRSASVSEGSTEAEVYATGGTAVLKGYTNGEVSGEVEKQLSGRGTMTLDSPADRLVLGVSGCPGITDSLVIS